MSAWAFSHAALALDCVDREEMRAKAASMIKRTAPKALPERPTLGEMRHSRLYTAGSCVCSCVRVFVTMHAGLQTLDSQQGWNKTNRRKGGEHVHDSTSTCGRWDLRLAPCDDRQVFVVEEHRG